MDVTRNTITDNQLKIIYSVGKKKFSKEKLHSLLEDNFGKKHFRELSREEAFRFMSTSKNGFFRFEIQILTDLSRLC